MSRHGESVAALEGDAEPEEERRGVDGGDVCRTPQRLYNFFLSRQGIAIGYRDLVQNS